MIGMSSSESVIYSLLHLALSNEMVDLSVDNIDWRDVLDISLGQGIAAIVYDGIQKLPENQLPEIDILFEWMGQTSIIESTYDAQFQSSIELANLWHQNGIRTLVLKGFSFSNNYPIPNHRPSSDLDCYLCGEYEKGNQLVEERGILVSREDYRHSTFNFGEVHVENHKICTTIRGKRKRKTFEAYLQSLLINEETKKINGSHLEIPCERFNALFFLQHAHRHFLREGIVLKHVCDWATMIKEYQCFDDSFWDLCQKNDLKGFADSLTRIAGYVCGIKASWLYEYSLQRADKKVLEDCFHISDNAIQYGNSFKAHLQMVKNMAKHRWKYHYFSEDSFIYDIITSVIGVVFEKNPEL